MQPGQTQDRAARRPPNQPGPPLRHLARLQVPPLSPLPTSLRRRQARRTSRDSPAPPAPLPYSFSDWPKGPTTSLAPAAFVLGVVFHGPSRRYGITNLARHFATSHVRQGPSGPSMDGFLLGPSRTGTRPGPGPLHPAPHGHSTARGPAPRFPHSTRPSARATAPLPAIGRLAHLLAPSRTPLFLRLGPAALPDSEAATRHAALRSSFGSGPPRCPTRKLRPGTQPCHTPLSPRLGPLPQPELPDQEAATGHSPPGHNNSC